MTNTLATKFASAVLAICISTASFAEVTDAKTVEFTYSTVELASAEGAAQLNERIEKFARQNCHTSSSFRPMGVIRDCRADIETQLQNAIWPNQD